MLEKQFTFKLERGFHARPARQFVELAQDFPCDVKLIKSDFAGNGKSALGIMKLGINQGDRITLRVDGEREDEALNALGRLLEQETE